MKLINIGFGNIVAANRVIAIVSPESAPIKRMIQEARDKGILIDATFGRRTRAVVVTDSEHIILSALQPRRWQTAWAVQAQPRRCRRRMKMQNKRGLLLVVSGPSGAGKGTVCKRLVEKRSDVFLSVSATTRAPREGEVDGKHYYFISEEEFTERIRTGGMLEHAVFCGNYYGTPKQAVDDMLAAGKNVILEIEVPGRDEGAQPLPGGRIHLCAAAVDAGAAQPAHWARHRGAGGRGGAAQYGCVGVYAYSEI